MRPFRLLFMVTFILFTLMSASYSATIYGVVTANNAPVADALVTATAVAGTPTIYTARSGQDGSYRLENVSPGMYVMTCTHLSYQVATAQIQVRGESVEINFDLKAGQNVFENVVHGKVVDCLTMKPIRGTIVHLNKLLLPGETTPVTYQTTTFMAGEFVFDNVVAGEYEVTAAKDAYLPFEKAQHIIIDENLPLISGLNLYMAPAGSKDLATVIGTVTLDTTLLPDSMQFHLARINLNSEANSKDSLLHFNTATNVNGTYSIENITPLAYKALCQPTLWQPVMTKDITLAANDTLILDFNYLEIPENEYGTITGKVTFSDDNSPVPNVYIEFIAEKDYYQIFPHFDGMAVTNENGEYSINLPEGTYYASCTYFSEDYQFIYYVYYDNVYKIADATPLTVIKDQTIENINFRIPKNDAMVHVKLAGTVTDNAGNPLENAAVTVWGACHLSNAAGNFRVLTDVQGHYQIEMDINRANRIGLNFLIVSAVKENYQIEFYNEKSKFYEADRIYVYDDVDMQNVNFTLEPSGPVSGNSISGTIYADDGSTIADAFVVATKRRSGRISFAISDALGKYKLTNLASGDYFVLAVAEGYIPEFYQDAMIWEKATPINVNGDITGIDFTLSPIASVTSTGGITGRIVNNSQLPISGALVTVVNNAEETVGYSLTDESGSYQVQGLTTGEYTVNASKVDYESASENVTYNQENASTQMIDMVLTPSTVTGVTTEKANAVLPADIALGNNYPNPFNPSTTISFSLPEAQQVRLVVYNLLGNEVRELFNGYKSAGNHQVAWDGKNNSGLAVSTGTYVISLEAGNVKVARKMLLNK